MPRLVGPACSLPGVSSTMLALTPLAACGMSVGDEQSTWGGQGPAPLVATPTGASSGEGKAP